MITSEKKREVAAPVQTHAGDVGSPQVQTAVLTARIKEITAHLRVHAHDFKARRGLLQMVGRRKRLLKYLEREDFNLYQDTVAKLGLRK